MKTRREAAQKMAKTICKTPSDCYGPECCANLCKLRATCELLHDNGYMTINEAIEKLRPVLAHAMYEAKITREQCRIIAEAVRGMLEEE